MKVKSLFILTLIGQSGLASEIDSFTRRYEELEDALPRINKKANEFLTQALEQANNEIFNVQPPSRSYWYNQSRPQNIIKNCDERQLYKHMRKYFRNHITGKLNPWLLQSNEVPKMVVSFQESIYQDFSFSDSPIPFILSKTSYKAFGTMLAIKGYRLGTDKFEHFLGSGFNYFAKHYLKGESVQEVLDFGHKLERRILGGQTSGVSSFGDRVANFNGMRFWNHVLSKRPDIYGLEPGALIGCHNRQWVQLRPIDFGPYIDAAWDEGINCSKYKTKEGTQKVLKHISKLQKQDPNNNYNCPIDPNVLDEVYEKYQPYSKDLINRDGISPIPRKDL